MSKRVLVYGSLAGALLYFGLNHVEERVDSLRTVNIAVPSSDANRLSIHQFYPVLAENALDREQAISGDINDAFFIAPPEPEIEVIAVAAQEVEKEREVVAPEPDPEPMEPINFLADRKGLFQLQATIPTQSAAIINGRAYQAGDVIPGILNFTYVDEYGDSQDTQLVIRVGRITNGEVVLTGKIKEDWEQHLTLSLNGRPS